MEKKEALRIIVEGAALYEKHLAGKNFMIIHSDNHNVFYMPTTFTVQGFMHLTGIDKPYKLPAAEFYNACLNRNLSYSDFEIRKDGTTEQKLSVLIQAMQFDTFPKMIGTYNGKGPYLQTDRLAGSIRACIGFIEDSGYYWPNTLLQDDMRKLINDQTKVLAMVSKLINASKYDRISYIAKGSCNLLLRPSVVEWATENMTDDTHTEFYRRIVAEKEALHNDVKVAQQKAKKRSRDDMAR